MSRAPLLAILASGFLSACGGGIEKPEAPPVPARTKGVDAPGDPGRRERFLAGASASEAPALVATNNPAHLDAVAAFFMNAQKAYPERVAALVALRDLRRQDGEEYLRLFPRVRPKLWEEIAHGDGLALAGLHEKAFVEAMGWLADARDPAARLKMELHLDRETVKRKRLPDAALAAAALGLASYSDIESARDTLWRTLSDGSERPVVRAAALKALQAFHPRELEERVLKIAAAPGDEWLLELQRKLR